MLIYWRLLHAGGNARPSSPDQNTTDPGAVCPVDGAPMEQPCGAAATSPVRPNETPRSCISLV